MYLATSVAVFYYLTRQLILFGFNAANIAIFIFFVSMVTATGVKIHNRAQDMSLEKKKGKFSIIPTRPRFHAFRDDRPLDSGGPFKIQPHRARNQPHH
jgi:hypothetical protein